MTLKSNIQIDKNIILEKNNYCCSLSIICVNMHK